MKIQTRYKQRVALCTAIAAVKAKSLNMHMLDPTPTATATTIAISNTTVSGSTTTTTTTTTTSATTTASPTSASAGTTANAANAYLSLETGVLLLVRLQLPRSRKLHLAHCTLICTIGVVCEQVRVQKMLEAKCGLACAAHVRARIAVGEHVSCQCILGLESALALCAWVVARAKVDALDVSLQRCVVRELRCTQVTAMQWAFIVGGNVVHLELALCGKDHPTILTRGHGGGEREEGGTNEIAVYFKCVRVCV